MIVWKAHAKPVYSLAFAADGNLLVTSGHDEVVRLWPSGSTEALVELPGSPFASPLALSADGRFLARGGYGIRAWAIGTSLAELLSDRDYTEAITWSPDGRVLAALGRAGVRRWEMPSGNSLPSGWGGTRESTAGRQYPTGGIAFRPGGTELATVFGVRAQNRYDSTIYIWDARTGELRQTLSAAYAYDHPRAIRFAPDGRFLAAMYGPILRVWDTDAGTVVAEQKPGTRHFKDLQFTPDGRQLVTVSNDRTARLWDTVTWAEVGGYEWKIGKLGAVAVTADGTRMAAGADSGKVVVWDADD